MSCYRDVRLLSIEQEAYMNTFIALRRGQDAIWGLEWRKHPAISDDWVEEARRGLTPISQVLGAC